MGRIILVRHGQTNFNIEGRVQGHSPNSILTKKGEMEAASLLVALRKIVPLPEEIFSSSCVRSIQNTKIVADGYHMGFTQDCRLDEMSMGSLEGLPYSAPGFTDYDSAIRKGDLSVADKYGAERMKRVLARMQDFFASLSGRKGNIIAIGHGAANGIYLSSLKGLSVGEYAMRQGEFSQKNCAINIITWDGKEFRLEATLANDYGDGEKKWN